MNKYIIFTLSFLLSNMAMACLPNRPTIVLLSAQTFEYKYLYKDPKAEFKSVVKEENIAVVKVRKTLRRNEWSKTVDVAIVELLHGWGRQFGRYMKAISPMTLCESDRVKDSGWHLAVLDSRSKGIEFLVPYNEVAPYLKDRGKPDYVYTPMGLMQ